MIIKYVCECCDRLVEEVLVSEELINLLREDDPSSGLTGLSPEAIMNLELQGSLVLETMCPECLAELEFDEGGTLALNTPIVN